MVENVPGATRQDDPAQVAKAPPDGYTVLVVFSSYVVNPSPVRKGPSLLQSYSDGLRAPAVTLDHGIVVNPSVPAQNVKELVSRDPRHLQAAATRTPGTSSTSPGQFRLKGSSSTSCRCR